MGLRDGVAVGRALALYRVLVVPRVRQELGSWRELAAAIPDPGPRETAVAAIDEKGLNVEAIAVFAILAPRRGRATAIRAMVALQVAIDYLDTLGEQGAGLDTLREQGAGLDTLGEQRSGLDTLGEQRAAGDSAYLDRLFGAYRERAGALPAHSAVAALLERAVARCGEGQAATHAAEHGDRAALETWARDLEAQARAPDAPPAYRWWEVAAGASSSVAAHALIAAAADPRTSAAEAELIDGAYFPSIGALTVLLDDLIDRDADIAAGAHNYLAYYESAAAAADRLDLIAKLGRAAIARLRHPHRHAAILTGVAGFYLSAAAAETPYARPVRDRLLSSTGPAVRPIVAFMRRRWR